MSGSRYSLRRATRKSNFNQRYDNNNNYRNGGNNVSYTDRSYSERQMTSYRSSCNNGTITTTTTITKKATNTMITIVIVAVIVRVYIEVNSPVGVVADIVLIEAEEVQEVQEVEEVGEDGIVEDMIQIIQTRL